MANSDRLRVRAYLNGSVTYQNAQAIAQALRSNSSLASKLGVSPQQLQINVPPQVHGQTQDLYVGFSLPSSADMHKVEKVLAGMISGRGYSCDVRAVL